MFAQYSGTGCCSLVFQWLGKFVLQVAVVLLATQSAKVLAQPCDPPKISTLVGHKSKGSGPAYDNTPSLLWNPSGLTIDADDNLYLSGGFGIFKIPAGTNRLETYLDYVAFSGGASNVIWSSAGFYFTNLGAGTVNKYTAGTVTKIAGNPNGSESTSGNAQNIKLFQPGPIAVDANGNVYVVQVAYNAIVKIDPNGQLSTFAGISQFKPLINTYIRPNALVIDRKGNLYISDYIQHVVWKIDVNKNCSVFAGKINQKGYTGDRGKAVDATLFAPSGLAVDNFGCVYFGDQSDAVVRRVDLTGNITTIAGNGTRGYSGDGGPATAAQFQPNVMQLVFDSKNNLYIVDCINQRIRKVDASTYAAVLEPITGPDVVCAGRSITLSEAWPGGTWSSLSPSVATVDATGVVIGLSKGTATIKYYYANACGNTSVQKDIQVNITTDNPKLTASATTVCSAGVTLTPSLAGGTWSSSDKALANVDNYGKVTRTSPLLKGEVTITYSYTSASVCVITTTATLPVVPDPAALQVTGDDFACTGSGTQLSANLPDVKWWLSATGVADVNTASGLVTAKADGEPIIYCTIDNACGKVTVEKKVTITTPGKLPSITGPTTVCRNGQITLRNSASGGTWSIPPPSVAQLIAPGVVAGVAAGSSIVTYTTTMKCGTGSTTYKVTVEDNAPCRITADNESPCIGTTVNLSADFPGGTWSVAPAEGTISQTGILTPTKSGMISVRYQYTNSCGALTATKTINVVQQPKVVASISGPDAICSGNSADFTINTTGGVWAMSPCTCASLDGNGRITTTSAGTATISYNVSNSCGNASITKDITIDGQPNAGTINDLVELNAGDVGAYTTGTTGGNWSLNNYCVASVSQDGMVYALTSGGNAVTYTMTNSCGSKTVTDGFTVKNIATTGGITGASLGCVNTTVRLVGTPAAGTWSTTTPSVTVTQAGDVIATAATTALINYTVGSTLYTRTVKFVTAPTQSITGPGSTCPGTPVTFTYKAIAGGIWSNEKPAIGAIDANTGIYTPVNTGTAIGGTDIVHYRVAHVCGDQDIPKTLNVTKPPFAGSISGTLSTVCLGNAISFTNSTTGGTWSIADAAVADINSVVGTKIIISGKQPGQTQVLYTITAPACNLTSVITRAIEVKALPVIGGGTNASVVKGAFTTLSNTTTNGAWQSADATIATVDSKTGKVTGVKAGDVTVTYKVTDGASGCFSTATYGIRVTEY